MDWRFIPDVPRSGSANMAADRLCLALAGETGCPVLRLYTWDGRFLSAGRNQKIERQLDLEACRGEGIPVVRRMTGGRAVLHGDDLTYAVAAPTGEMQFGRGIMEIYRRLSQVFLFFFGELGFQPEVITYSAGRRAELISPVCFSTPSAFELLVGGRKVVGSAQRLLPNAFLQHGSIPMAPQYALLARLFQGVSEAELRAQMTDLETLGLWERMGRDAAVAALGEAFAEVLQVKLERRPWTADERERISALEAEFPYIGAGRQPVAGAPPPRRPLTGLCPALILHGTRSPAIRQGRPCRKISPEGLRL